MNGSSPADATVLGDFRNCRRWGFPGGSKHGGGVGVLSFSCSCFFLLPVCCQIRLSKLATVVFPGSMDPESRDAASETVSQNRPLGCLAQVFGHRGAKGIDVMPMVVYLYMALWGRMFEEAR